MHTRQAQLCLCMTVVLVSAGVADGMCIVGCSVGIFGCSVGISGVGCSTGTSVVVGGWNTNPLPLAWCCPWRASRRAIAVK